MENNIDILKGNITKLQINKVTVTDEALMYFKRLKPMMEGVLSEDVLPDTMDKFMEYNRKLDELENFLVLANKNSESTNKVIDVRDILLKIDFIKKLMLSQDEDLRADAYEIFLTFAPLYTKEETQEFVDTLTENELKNAISIVEYERKYLIERPLNSTSLELLCKNRLEYLKTEKGNKDNANFKKKLEDDKWQL